MSSNIAKDTIAIINPKSAELFKWPCPNSIFGTESKKDEHERMRINTEIASVTLTFVIGVWLYLATHCLNMANTCAKLF